MMRIFCIAVLMLVGMLSSSWAIDKNIVIKGGESVVLRGTALTVAFTEVLQDSRCPPDVSCVWEGVMTVALRITAGKGRPRDFTITNVSGRDARIILPRGQVMTLTRVVSNPPSLRAAKSSADLPRYSVLLAIKAR